MADQVEIQADFHKAGRHSYPKAPAQDQKGFLDLENIRPPDRGVFFKRFGYTQFNAHGTELNRLFEYQRDSDNSRRILGTSTLNVAAFNEDGTDYNPSIFLVGASATEHPRVVPSRDFAFFQDGDANDVLKWNGSGQNYLIHSEEFDHADWIKTTGSITSTSKTDPLGGTTADEFTPSGANGSIVMNLNALGINPPAVASKTFTFSIWVRAVAGTKNGNIQIQNEGGANRGVFGVVATTTWQRFSVTATMGGVDTGIRAATTLWDAAAGDIVEFWGAQLNFGSVAGTYEVTTTAAITGVSNWGIVAPTTAIGVGLPSAGAVTLEIGRKYFLVFRNSTTGHHSDLNPVSASTGPQTAQDIPLSSIEVDTDPQTDRKVILATADGGDQTILFFLADIPNAQTTFTDDIPEDTLLASNVYLEVSRFGDEIGLTDNTPPPVLTLITKHRGRIWGAGKTSDPQFVFFSKTIADLTTSSGTLTGRYEEAWPASNFFDISAGAESVSGLFSDGVTLFVATERHIRRILGDGQTLQKPEILFNNVGVVNQDVWKTVFVTGTPAGTMFLTPDKKVIFTDFNTYQDVGEPIQDLLSTINTSTIQTSYAEFYSSEGDDWYALAIPTGSNTKPDTILLFDTNGQTWYTWVPSDKVNAMLTNIKADGTIQWLWAGDDSNLHKFQAASTQDREGGTPVSFTSTVETTWRHFTLPQALKVLNKIKLFSADASIAVSVDGASTRAEFDTPTSILSGGAAVSGPLGDLEVYLAGLTTKDRFYKFTFVTTGDLAATAPMLSYFEVHHVPYHVF